MEKDTTFQRTSPSSASPRQPGVFQGTPDAPALAPVEEPFIRTMKGDIAEAIKRQNESYVSIALAEEQKRKAEATTASAATKEAPPADTAIPKRRGRALVVIGVFLLIVVVGLSLKFLAPGIGMVQIPELSFPNFGGYTELATSTTPVSTPEVPLAPSLIPAQSEKRFNLSQETPESVGAAIAGEIALGLPLGTVKNFYLTEDGSGTDGEMGSRAVGIGQLLSFAGATVSDVLARTLEHDFMAGIFSASDGPVPFLILNVSSYEGGLAGMLLWEKELTRFFDVFFGGETESAGALERATWRDAVILDRDARMSERTDGQAIAYAFAEARTIVIAGSQSALRELLPKVAGDMR